jgi:hypothetical protein
MGIDVERLRAILGGRQHYRALVIAVSGDRIQIATPSGIKTLPNTLGASVGDYVQVIDGVATSVSRVAETTFFV